MYNVSLGLCSYVSSFSAFSFSERHFEVALGQVTKKEESVGSVIVFHMFQIKSAQAQQPAGLPLLSQCALPEKSWSPGSCLRVGLRAARGCMWLCVHMQ